MSSIKQLNSEINKIKQRNKRVEADKAWETSTIRKVIIALLTYIIIVIFLYSVNLPKPFSNAIVPALAFFLSTLTIPLFKNWWFNNIYKK